jgi:O-antigen ligase
MIKQILLQSLPGIRRTPILNITLILFLSANFVSRLGSTYLTNQTTTVVFTAVVVIGIVLRFFEKGLKPVLFLFAVTFPLYGSHSYSAYNHVFEFIITSLCLVFWLLNQKEVAKVKINNHLNKLLIIYIFLSASSLFLLPVNSVFNTAVLWGFFDFSKAVFIASPDSVYYSLAGVNRLILFYVFIYQLATYKENKESFRFLFLGLLIGGLISAVVGILNHYGIIGLDWYRPGFEQRLQSVFGNPGWFAEYIAICSPFFLLGFVKTDLKPIWKFSLFGGLIICEMAILLTGSRTGWVAYPMVLLFCWLFFYLFRKSNEKSKTRNLKTAGIIGFRVLISVPITLLISFIIIFQIFENPELIGPKNSQGKTNSQTSDQHKAYIKDRISNIASATTRTKLWREGIVLGSASSLFGLGYETYRWHMDIQSNNPNTELRKKNLISEYYDTAHNTFIQLFVSGGIVALFIWVSIIGYSILILLMELKRNKNYIIIPIILSIISFHIYGLAQSMQYISMIWLTVFLNIGYAMTINSSLNHTWLGSFWNKYIIAVAILAVIGSFTYISNHSSKNLAEKYDMQIYANDQMRDNFPGFYRVEQWPQGNIRWMGKRGLVKFSGSGLVELAIYCGHPDVKEKPVSLIVTIDKTVVDYITFNNNQWINKLYYIPKSKLIDHELLLKVSRAWSPLKYNINKDNRSLGVAVKDLQISETFNKDQIGFHGIETWNGKPIAEWPPGKPIRFRWSSIQSSLKIKDVDYNEGITLFVMAAHPDISAENPVKLKVFGEKELVRELEFRNNQWNKIEITSSELKDFNVLTFSVNRTWSPNRLGFSSDVRELGVALAEVY